jgi:hypothetical protein
MQWKTITFATLASTFTLLAGCSYNPFITNNHTTGSPVGTAIGAGIGAGSVALLGGTKPYIALGGLVGGAIGYYVTTLRYDAGGVIQAGGNVYKIGDYVGIYIPTDNVFEPNTDSFLPQAGPILDSAVAVLMRYPKNNILISGNTSGFYCARWEQELSERRAEKVSAYLWNAGINQFITPTLNLRKLNYVGYGDYFPIAKPLTNNGIRENSRIQITSYPSNCDLDLDQYHLAVHNIGGMDANDRIAEAGPTPSDCSTMNTAGECVG